MIRPVPPDPAWLAQRNSAGDRILAAIRRYRESAGATLVAPAVVAVAEVPPVVIEPSEAAVNASLVMAFGEPGGAQ